MSHSPTFNSSLKTKANDSTSSGVSTFGICLGVLAFQGKETILNSLNSYRDGKLLDVGGGRAVLPTPNDARARLVRRRPQPAPEVPRLLAGHRRRA